MRGVRLCKCTLENGKMRYGKQLRVGGSTISAELKVDGAGRLPYHKDIYFTLVGIVCRCCPKGEAARSLGIMGHGVSTTDSQPDVVQHVDGI